MYTIEIAKDENRDIFEGGEQWSLKYLMATCQDFARELTALQHVGQVLGVSVLVTPKFHAKKKQRCSQNRGCAKAFKTSKSIHMCIFHSSATTMEQQQLACTHLASQ
jgi:hypothetical protein